MKGNSLILDFYVDEPACFGVPPFIAPYPRYICGALLDAGISPDAITYRSVDTLRQNNYIIEEYFEHVFLIGGAVVPGKYLGQKIGTIDEIQKTLLVNPSLHFNAGGLAALQLATKKIINLRLITGDIEQFAYDTICGEADFKKMRSNAAIARWAVAGAVIVTQHPGYPDLVCEIESYRGCPRSSHCSFCSEQLFGDTLNNQYRSQSDILAEVDTLTSCGITRFRMGRQADILAYGSPCEEYIATFPRPNPDTVISLFKELGERRKMGKIDILNVDNANPGTIFHFQKESHLILAAIADAVSPGDTLPLGVESFDPAVVAANNLKVDRSALIQVVEIMNSAGGWRERGIPKLLPGINLIHGLKGETTKSFKHNFEALSEILDKNLLLRRINIRTLLPFPGTASSYNPSQQVINRYRYYRDKIRSEIDAPMLKKVFPSGAVLTRVRIEGQRTGVSYGRQLSSYAITLKIKSDLPVGSFYTMAVCGHEERSLRAFPIPLVINQAPAKLLESVEGIGKKRVQTIILSRPFADRDSFFRVAESIPNLLRDKIEL